VRREPADGIEKDHVALNWLRFFFGTFPNIVPLFLSVKHRFDQMSIPASRVRRVGEGLETANRAGRL
jgi:hypothetical protein